MLGSNVCSKFPFELGDPLALAEPAASQYLQNGFLFLCAHVRASDKNHPLVFSDRAHA
jgi:hypothetical protein